MTKPTLIELSEWADSEAQRWLQCVQREDATNKLRKAWKFRARQLSRIANELRIAHEMSVASMKEAKP